jgi:hypothetical protein
MLRSSAAGVLLAGILVSAVCQGAEPEDLGFDNTPFLPNSPWRVHDRSRPRFRGGPTGAGSVVPFSGGV